MLTKPCLICKKTILKLPYRSLKDWHNRTKYCSDKCKYEALKERMKNNRHSLGVKQSKETRLKHSLAQRGEKGSNWRGDKVGYTGIHHWLRTNYGKATKCENPDCHYPRQGVKKLLLKPYRYEWALIKGKSYIRERDNFMQFCTSCHRKQDGNKKYD